MSKNLGERKDTAGFFIKRILLLLCIRVSKLCHLDAGVAGGHGLDVEGGAHDVAVCSEAGLRGPRPVTLPSVRPHAEPITGQY